MSKSALIVAIWKYPAATNLPGAEQDLADWRALLTTFGFSVTRLENAAATKKGITDGLEALLKGSVAGDEFAFIYSGHGTSTRLFDGLVGYFETGSANEQTTVVTSELDRIIRTNLAAGAKLTVVLDCCHAQAVLPPPPAFALAKSAADDECSKNAPDQVRSLKYDSSADTLNTVFKRVQCKFDSIALAIRKFFGSSDEPLRLFATEEDKLAYEGMLDGEFRGYFSHSLTKTVRAHPEISHDDAILAAEDLIEPRHRDQIPHIKGARRTNPFLT